MFKTKEKNDQTKLKEFANRLKRALAKNEKSQAELARDLILTRASVNAWVKGKDYPSHDRIEKISRILKVHPAYLEHGIKVSSAETNSVLNKNVPIHIVGPSGETFICSVSVPVDVFESLGASEKSILTGHLTSKNPTGSIKDSDRSINVPVKKPTPSPKKDNGGKRIGF